MIHAIFGYSYVPLPHHSLASGQAAAPIILSDGFAGLGSLSDRMPFLPCCGLRYSQNLPIGIERRLNSQRKSDLVGRVTEAQSIEDWNP
jgi:hypothetical protein